MLHWQIRGYLINEAYMLPSRQLELLLLLHWLTLFFLWTNIKTTWHLILVTCVCSFECNKYHPTSTDEKYFGLKKCYMHSKYDFIVLWFLLAHCAQIQFLYYGDFFQNQLNFIWMLKMFIFHLNLYSFIPSLSCLWLSNLLNPDA